MDELDDRVEKVRRAEADMLERALQSVARERFGWDGTEEGLASVADALNSRVAVTQTRDLADGRTITIDGRPVYRVLISMEGTQVKVTGEPIRRGHGGD